MADIRSTTAEKKPFLRRWSERKQENKQQTKQQQIKQPPEEVRVNVDEDLLLDTPELEQSDTAQVPLQTESSGQTPAVKEAEKPFEQLSDADMPKLDSLGEHSDYRQFLAPKVSTELRTLALRKLFHLPQFNLRDGLDDYDDDFTYFEPLGDTVTADMKHMMEVAQKREEAKKREAAERLEQEQAQQAAVDANVDQEKASMDHADTNHSEQGAIENDNLVDVGDSEASNSGQDRVDNKMASTSRPEYASQSKNL